MVLDAKSITLPSSLSVKAAGLSSSAVTCVWERGLKAPDYMIFPFLKYRVFNEVIHFKVDAANPRVASDASKITRNLR